MAQIKDAQNTYTKVSRGIALWLQQSTGEESEEI